MMKLSDNSIWASLFYFFDEVVERGTDADFYIYRRPAQTDICQYIRVVFLWGPLILLTEWASWAFAAFVMLYYPITQFGVGYIVFWLSIGGVALVICGLVWLCRRPLPTIKEPKVVSEAGEMISSAYRGFKDKYCPIIELKETR